MDLFFNELALQPYAPDKTEAYNRMHQFITTFKKARAYGYKAIRFQQQFPEIPLCENYTMQDYCNESSNSNRSQRTLLLGLRRYPFIEDDSNEAEEYLKNNFYIDKENTLLPCHGLAAAYLYSSTGIGFLSEDFWDNVSYRLIIKNNENTERVVICVSSEQHVESREFLDWFESVRDVQLTETTIQVSDKRIHLRDDHGKDKLLAFAKKIVESPYVMGVINSLPFNPHCSDFIKKVNSDGTIELALTWTDEGFGMVIKTTGRNLKEINCITDILRKEYCRK